MPYRISSRDEYPPWVGLIFVFNLIVGTGALTLPAAFANAGWVLSLVILIFLAFLSYVTVTFVIETMACANAVMHWRRLQFLKKDRASNQENDDEQALLDSEIDDDDETLIHHKNAAGRTSTNNLIDGAAPSTHEMSDSSIEQTPLFSQSSRYYVLDNKIELGQMAGIFLNDTGRAIFYICIAIYLYGDLSIYSAAVAKSLRDVICTTNISSNDTLDGQLCWQSHTLSRLDVYRLCLIGFAMTLGPFAFFNVQKTKYIQLITAICRSLAFTIMITIAIYKLSTEGANGSPPMANIAGLPSLLGVTVYSFMCHHSLPSLIVPISDKRQIKSILFADYSLITFFYIFLALTGIFAFTSLEDLYTLNFVPGPNQQSTLLKIVEYFLALFPVFTLSTSFPIIAITLRNNLQTLFLDVTNLESYNFFPRRILFPLMAILPPVVVTFFTENLTDLVGFTGSYAGTLIQYMIPVALVYSARNTCSDLLGQGVINEFRSPFRSILWLVFIVFWAFACTVLVSIRLFRHRSSIF